MSNCLLNNVLFFKAESIANVMSCQSVVKRAMCSSEDFAALLYATLTSFEFDSDSSIVNKW